MLVNDALAGFALVNNHSPSGKPVDYAMAEFFVLRARRRQHVGRAAAHRLFRQLPGIWEIGVIPRNKAAWQFWRTTVSGADVLDLTEQAGNFPNWHGTVFRFRSPLSLGSA